MRPTASPTATACRSTRRSTNRPPPSLRNRKSQENARQMPASLLAALQLPPATSCPEGSRGCRRSVRATATRKGRAHERVDAKTLAVRGGAPPLAAPPDQPGGKDPVRQRHLAARLPDYRYFRRRRAAACRGF